MAKSVDKALAAEAGTRLADRYRLEDRLSVHAETVTWRAVDEKLRRAVGIHLIAGGSERARSVIAAARSAALIGDPRFVQVLDAAEWDGIVYVVKEWLPDADNLTSLLSTTPLPPHEIYEMARSLSAAMAVAHRAGLSHLRLDPENVLRMRTGQYKIVGLSVEAALYGAVTDDAARADTHSVGALVYAALTRRWPGKPAYGLPEAPAPGRRLAAPGQVRAGVHEGLEAIAMRALGHEFAHQPPFATPQEIADAVDALPPILPPEPDAVIDADDYEHEYGASPVFAAGPPIGGGRSLPPPPPLIPDAPPPALGGGFGRFAKGLVALIVLVVAVLLTWQIALFVNERNEPKKDNSASAEPSSPSSPAVPPANGNVVKPVRAVEWDPDGSGQRGNPADTYDNNPGTYWRTAKYDDPNLRRLKSGVGVVYDFGKVVDLRSVDIDLLFDGSRAGGGRSNHTVIEVRATPAGVTSMPAPRTPVSKDFTVKIGKDIDTRTKEAKTSFAPVRTQFVLIWFTELPDNPAEEYSGAGLKQGITEIVFKD